MKLRAQTTKTGRLICQALGILLLLAGAHAPVLAQSPVRVASTSHSSIQSALSDIRPGTPLRMSILGRSTVARFVGLLPDGLVLSSLSTGIDSLRATQIDTVWVQRRSTGRGARIGALVGGIVMGAWTFGFAEDDCDVTCAAPFALGIGLGGAGVGALGGAMLGSQLPSWLRLYP
jgi:hypothetical protein